jgi:hypothetical protein
MIPKEFPQQNNVLAKPADMTDEQCSGLPCFHYSDPEGFSNVLSFWAFTPGELEEATRAGGIWVNTMGKTVAPFALFTKDPFISADAQPG